MRGEADERHWRFRRTNTFTGEGILPGNAAQNSVSCRHSSPRAESEWALGGGGQRLGNEGVAERPSSAGGNSNRLIGWVRPRRGGLMASMDTLAWCAWRSDQVEARKVGALSFRDAAESPKTADRC